MILTKESVEEIVKRLAGGKGYNLFLLTKADYNVPSWVVIGADVFKKYIQENQLEQKIQDILNSLSANVITTPQTVEILKCLFNKAAVSSYTKEQIQNAYVMCESTSVAVRSSGIGEDLPGYSFAGQFDSFLKIKSGSEVYEKVKLCWLSAFSERVLSYRIQHDLPLDLELMQIAVIIQQMIEGDKSGVTFSTDPRSNEPLAIINAVNGLGEGLVSGKVEPDTYIVANEIKEKIIIGKPVLTNDEIMNITSQSRKIEGLYSFPQDIEWTILNEKLYILQSRPITTYINQLPGRLAIWDNSNIIESYSGLTLPLTFTFARYVYHQVYVQFCELLCLPQSEIKNMNYFLSNMLGLFYGRVYYNLLNWYRLTSILPGFSMNREFMETMMGTKKSLESEIASRIQFTPSTYSKKWAKFIKIVTGVTFAFNHFVIKKKTEKFLRHFNKIYTEYRQKNYSLMTIDQQFQAYFNLERVMLREWKEPIINDFLCMVHFGLFKKICAKWFPENKDLMNDLLCGVGNIESTKPTKLLLELAKEANKNAEVKSCILNTPSIKAIEAIKQIDTSFYEKIEDFRDKYGYRCMNEMKLETQDLYEDSSFIFECLRNYLSQNSIDDLNIDKKEEETQFKAYKYVDTRISGIKKAFFIWVAKNAEDTIRRREELRFCRTKIYGVVRAIFNGIGKQYALRGLINSPRDVFYLELSELLSSYDGTLTNINLKQIIQARKKSYEEYKQVTPKSRFITRGLSYWNNEDIIKNPVMENSQKSDNQLHGIPCSPGTARAKVIVVDGTEKDLKLNGEILVTVRTDPGWIPLYPSISGLIIERGGLLSHSAIVAREMGIPTIVGLHDATNILKTGMTIRMNGATGEIYI